MTTLSFWIQMVATAAFAITAVLALADPGVDLFAAMVLGIITAVGGGTVRDVILGVPVFWVEDQTYIWVALTASVVAFASRSFLTQPQVLSSMLYIDGLGAALFGIQGASKSWQLDFGLPVAPVILGITTAIGGGLIRDVLAGRQTLLMSRELYAIPVTIGCVVYAGLVQFFPEQIQVAAFLSIILIFSFRAAAIHWNLRMPDRFITRPRG
jgi:uncharacterized membrane protein YeiH